jgi:hypothetical protein
MEHIWKIQSVSQFQAESSRVEDQDEQEFANASWGPSVWKSIHEFALTPPSDAATIVRFYSVTIPSQIQCYACLEKYMKLLRTYPIPSVPSDLFEWTVKLHNIVNLMLKKPIMDVHEAHARSLKAM